VAYFNVLSEYLPWMTIRKNLGRNGENKKKKGWKEEMKK
jgi:hypothetical protein